MCVLYRADKVVPLHILHWPAYFFALRLALSAGMFAVRGA
jgi:hypothetical protein